MYPTRNGVTFRDGVPAVNVKSRACRSTFHCYAPGFERAADDLGEAVVQDIEESVREQFWQHDAPEVASEFGYGEVFSEGRMGGWLVVSKAPTLESGDESYVSPDDLERNRRQWLEFEGRIVALVAWCEREFARRVVDEAATRAGWKPYIVAVLVPIKGANPVEAWERYTSSSACPDGVFVSNPFVCSQEQVDDPDFEVPTVRYGGADLEATSAFNEG